MIRKTIITAILAAMSISAFAQLDTLKHKYYTSVFDTKLLHPKYVTWLLTPAMTINNNTDDRAGTFTADPLETHVNTNLTDDYKDPYDHGHFMPAKDNAKLTPTDMKDCFRTTNIFPQYKTFNRVTWLGLESHSRDEAQKQPIRIYAVAVGTTNKKLGRIDIPTKAAKFLVYKDSTRAWIYPNDATAVKYKWNNPIYRVHNPDSLAKALQIKLLKP